MYLVRLDERFFSGAVEIFFGQRCLSPLEKMGRTPMTVAADEINGLDAL